MITGEGAILLLQTRHKLSQLVSVDLIDSIEHSHHIKRVQRCGYMRVVA